jgi:hypothetical protein
MWCVSFIHNLEGAEIWHFADYEQARVFSLGVPYKRKYPVTDVVLAEVVVEPLTETCLLYYSHGTSYYCRLHEHTTECELIPPFCEVVPGGKCIMVGQLNA